MTAKEAAKKTKAIVAERGAAAAKALPRTLEEALTEIKKSVDHGSNFARVSVFYNDALASMLSTELRKLGYKLELFIDGGYNYDGEYLGPTTEYTIHVHW